MNNEQPKTTQTAENPEKIFNSKDLEGKNQQEQMLRIDNAMDHLDLASEDFRNVVGATEIERRGGESVAHSASLFERIKLGTNNLINNREGYDAKLASIGRKLAERNVNEMQRGLGREVVALKEKIATHEAVSQNDLEAIRSLPGIKPKVLKSMEEKMLSESASLKLDKENKERELQEKIAEYPVFEKQEKIANLLGEYGEIEKVVLEKKNSLGANIKEYEMALKKIKGTTDTSLEIKNHISAQVEILKKQHEEMADRERGLKERLALLRASQNELSPFAKKLNEMGKTKEELIAESKARLNGKSEKAKVDAKNTKLEGASTEKDAGDGSQTKEKAPEGTQGTEEEPKSKFEVIKKMPQEWAKLIRKVAPAMAGKEVMPEFYKKAVFGEMNGADALKLLAKYFLETKKVRSFDKAIKEAEKILEKVLK